MGVRLFSFVIEKRGCSNHVSTFPPAGKLEASEVVFMTKKTETETENGTMVRDMKDLVEHSKIMEHMKTNKELEKEGKRPDPVQHKEDK